MRGRALRGGGKREERRASEHEHGAAEDSQPADAACVAKFVEEKIAPEDAEEAVDIPEREGNAKADVADGENRKSVGDGPETACKDSPYDQVRGASNVRAHLTRAPDERGQAPPRQKGPYDHQERNYERRNAQLYEFGRGLRCAEPGTRTKPAEYSHKL